MEDLKTQKVSTSKKASRRKAKNKFIGVKVNEDEYNFFQAIAEVRNLNLSEYVRLLLWEDLYKQNSPVYKRKTDNRQGEIFRKKVGRPKKQVES